jgi:hypothetical protein
LINKINADTPLALVATEDLKPPGNKEQGL